MFLLFFACLVRTKATLLTNHSLTPLCYFLMIPNPVTQVIRGTVDPATGEYRNKFYRPGKVLHSDITIKPGILRNLATRAKGAPPPVYEG